MALDGEDLKSTSSIPAERTTSGSASATAWRGSGRWLVAGTGTVTGTETVTATETATVWTGTGEGPGAETEKRGGALAAGREVIGKGREAEIDFVIQRLKRLKIARLVTENGIVTETEIVTVTVIGRGNAASPKTRTKKRTKSGIANAGARSAKGSVTGAVLHHPSIITYLLFVLSDLLLLSVEEKYSCSLWALNFSNLLLFFA